MTNPYHDAMDRCAPPEGLRERIEENVLAGRPGRSKTFKPRGFRKKAAVVLLAAVLLLTGATTIWDPLFVRRFGPGAALSALGGAVFQEVNVTSVCGDVSLTVTQALCSDKTIHYILEYRLPEGAPEDASYRFPEYRCYGTGDYTWEELRDLCREDWNKVDWADYVSVSKYLNSGNNPLRSSRLWMNSGSGSFKCEAKDGVLTFYLTGDFTQEDLTAQPLTVLMAPPFTKDADGKRVSVTDHPAIVTFQPVYNGPQARSASLEEGDVKLTATLSPFSLALEADGMGYPSYEDMVEDTRLVARDGTEKAVNQIGYTSGGSSFGPEGQPMKVSTTVHFILLTDISEFTAIRMGDYELPLN